MWALLVITLLNTNTVEVRRVAVFTDLRACEHVLTQLPNAHCVRMPKPA